MEIRIVIAEDHQLVREGFVRILKEKCSYKIVGEANDGIELLKILSTLDADVVLLDLEMPVMSGGEALEFIKKNHPAVKIIIVSNYYDNSLVTEYFLKGAHAYLPKNCDVNDLYTTIDFVFKNGYCFPSDIGTLLINKINSDKEKEEAKNKKCLTETEIMILKLLCEEKTSKKIAEETGLSVYVIDHHRRSIMNKTEQSTTIGLIKYAIKNGLTKLE